MKKKNLFTLLEIMIVIFLIGLIGSVIGYNMKGSLTEGKAFKTKQAILKIKELLELEISKGADPKKVQENPSAFLKATGVVKDPDKLLLDGWGEKMTVVIEDGETIQVTSQKYELWKQSKKADRGQDVEDEE